MKSVIAWLSEHLMPCYYKQLLGVSCPMCGCQRGMLLLLQGDTIGALMRFPPLAAWAVSFVAIIIMLLRRKHSTPHWHLLLYANLFILFLNALNQNFVAL